MDYLSRRLIPGFIRAGSLSGFMCVICSYPVFRVPRKKRVMFGRILRNFRLLFRIYGFGDFFVILFFYSRTSLYQVGLYCVMYILNDFFFGVVCKLIRRYLQIRGIDASFCNGPINVMFGVVFL